MAQTPRPMISPDGRWYWDGTGWKSLVSADGRSRWSGTAWIPLEVSSPLVGEVAGEAGRRGPSEPPPPPPPPAPPPAMPAMAPLPPGPVSPWIAANYPGLKQTASYQGTSYAGFWIRFLAYFIDSLIIGIPIVIVFVVVIVLTGPYQSTDVTTGRSDPRASGINLLALVIGAAYFAYFWSLGSTPGMRLFKLRVVDSNSRQTIGLGRALVRYLGLLLSGVCCYIGLIWAAFDGQKQGWHDKIASTVVVYEGRGTTV